MTKLEHNVRFWEFLLGNEEDFYDKFLRNLSEKELEGFLRDNPEYQIESKS